MGFYIKTPYILINSALCESQKKNTEVSEAEPRKSEGFHTETEKDFTGRLRKITDGQRMKQQKHRKQLKRQ